jgi:Protein of unknown function (DUF3175)
MDRIAGFIGLRSRHAKLGLKAVVQRRKKMARKHARSKTKGTRRWSGKVTTDSTHPPEGLFKKSAPAIARALASKRVSPKGPGSGMRMLTFYINRAGRNLSASRWATLKRAKELLSERMHRAPAKRRSKK